MIRATVIKRMENIETAGDKEMRHCSFRDLRGDIWVIYSLYKAQVERLNVFVYTRKSLFWLQIKIYEIHWSAFNKSDSVWIYMLQASHVYIFHILLSK